MMCSLLDRCGKKGEGKWLLTLSRLCSRARIPFLAVVVFVPAPLRRREEILKMPPTRTPKTTKEAREANGPTAATKRGPRSKASTTTTTAGSEASTTKQTPPSKCRSDPCPVCVRVSSPHLPSPSPPLLYLTLPPFTVPLPFPLLSRLTSLTHPSPPSTLPTPAASSTAANDFTQSAFGLILLVPLGHTRRHRPLRARPYRFPLTPSLQSHSPSSPALLNPIMSGQLCELDVVPPSRWERGEGCSMGMDRTRKLKVAAQMFECVSSFLFRAPGPEAPSSSFVTDSYLDVLAPCPPCSPLPSVMRSSTVLPLGFGAPHRHDRLHSQAGPSWTPSRGPNHWAESQSQRPRYRENTTPVRCTGHLTGRRSSRNDMVHDWASHYSAGRALPQNSHLFALSDEFLPTPQEPKELPLPPIHRRDLTPNEFASQLSSWISPFTLL
ncbi:hypothetical protein NMY22_g14993 [Coprinellus aureogranulatus]|nr:hypothetical protein NMY22_g14993 [Coprinellus aureogranulatus]